MATLQQAVGAVAERYGFSPTPSRTRDKAWARAVGDCTQTIELRVLHGLEHAAIGLASVDRTLRSTMEEIVSDPPMRYFPTVSSDLKLLAQLPVLRRTDAAHAEAAASALTVAGLAFLNEVSTSEGMIAWLEKRCSGRWTSYTAERIDLALLYLKSSDPGRGCDLLADPPRRTRENPKWIELVMAVRSLCCRAAGRSIVQAGSS